MAIDTTLFEARDFILLQKGETMHVSFFLVFKPNKALSNMRAASLLLTGHVSSTATFSSSAELESPPSACC